MPVTMEQTADLANRIVSKKQFEIYERFSSRLTRKEKMMYVRETEKDGVRSLAHSKEEFSRRRIVGMKGKRKGRHFRGKRRFSEAMRAFIDELDRAQSKGQITKRGIPNGYEITVPAEGFRLGKGFEATNVGSSGMTITKGRGYVGPSDRLLLEAIREWADSNGFDIVVSS